LKDGLTPELKAMLEDVIAKESEFFEKEVDSEEVLATPWGVDESTWYDRLVNDVALWCAYILVDIKQHLLKRNHIDDVLVKLDKRFKSMENILTALGLSESTAIGSLSRKQIFKELGIDKYRFYARVDERTCETCGSLHGLVFPISAYEVGVTASPVHPRCRCWEVPITE
jgi:SPP1 gp7 family putative phage head morphogenesis protein